MSNDWDDEPNEDLNEELEEEADVEADAEDDSAENGADEENAAKTRPKGKNYMTPNGMTKLKSEYLELFHNERPKLVETVAWAAGNGDRSENADYIYGKRRLREIDRRLRFLSSRMESAVVVDVGAIKNDKVAFGATVTLEDEEGKAVVYQIVGEDESDAATGKISWQSPLAQGLIGKGEGDEALIQRPIGEKVYTVLKIVYQS